MHSSQIHTGHYGGHHSHMGASQNGLCQNVFRFFFWFILSLKGPPSKKNRYIVPSHIFALAQPHKNSCQAPSTPNLTERHRQKSSRQAAGSWGVSSRTPATEPSAAAPGAPSEWPRPRRCWPGPAALSRSIGFAAWVAHLEINLWIQMDFNQTQGFKLSLENPKPQIQICSILKGKGDFFET